jgi:hypothetical protein
LDGSTDWAFNVSAPGSAYPGSKGSEMAYLYYVELGNKGLYDTNGNPQSGYGLLNTGLFTSLMSWPPYWSGSERTGFTQLPDTAWIFHFDDGELDWCSKSGNNNYALAVHEGNITNPTPEPATILLMAFGTGVMGGGIRRLRKKFKK